MSLKKRILWGFIIFFACVLVVGCFVPFRATGIRYCKYCRASLGQDLIFGIPIQSWLVERHKLATYWRKEVEPAHTHIWSRFNYASEISTLRIRTARVSAGIFSEDEMIAVLKSLPTLKAQKAVVEQLWALWWDDMPEKDFDKLCIKLSKIHSAYRENPNRKDWSVILKKLGVKVPK